MTADEEKAFVLASLNENRPSAPRTAKLRKLQKAIDYAIASINRDVTSEKVAAYKQGYKDGIKDAARAKHLTEVTK